MTVKKLLGCSSQDIETHTEDLHSFLIHGKVNFTSVAVHSHQQYSVTGPAGANNRYRG